MLDADGGCDSAVTTRVRSAWKKFREYLPILTGKGSHTRTVVRECCKGDDASQRENGKFDPLPRPNPLTDRHKKLHT